MADILVIDDNSAVRLAYRLLLINAGHSVTEAVDGQAGIRCLAIKRFELVITDLWMPGLDGFAVIAEAKRLHPGMPVLALTGGALGPGADDPSGRARAAGADVVIEKPMLGEGFLVSVEALLARAS
ncbi:MAG: response regulator [Rhodospirillaceae bacterium]